MRRSAPYYSVLRHFATPLIGTLRRKTLQNADLTSSYAVLTLVNQRVKNQCAEIRRNTPKYAARFYVFLKIFINNSKISINLRFYANIYAVLRRNVPNCVEIITPPLDYADLHRIFY
jgi:hypothetical protein